MIYSSNSADLSLSRFLLREGCRLQYLIATTYTVDCETLVSLSSAVYNAVSVEGPLSGPADVAAPSLADVCLDFPEILDCAADHIRLYTQYPPDSASRPRALYENAISLFHICGRIMNQPHTFHPKLLLAVFDHCGKPEFHLQVGSKNLTASYALDLSVCLESDPASPDGGNCNGSQLAAFFQANQIALPEGILEALRQTNFRILGGDSPEMKVSDIVFAYNSKAHTIADTLQEDARNRPAIAPVHVFSPFLHPDSSGAFWGEELGKDVIYHTNLTKTILKQGQETPLPNLYVSKADQQFYHGKLILWPVAMRGTEAASWNDRIYEDTFRIWIGSANATQNGMTRNSELMVGLLMKVTHSSTARKNRYPDYFESQPSLCHSLNPRIDNRISENGISFYRYSSMSHLSDSDCFPDDQGPLLRHLLQNIFLQASMGHGTPMLEVKIKCASPSPVSYFVRVSAGSQELCDLPYEKSVCQYEQTTFPANGVYQVCLLDACRNCILSTYVQAAKGEGVAFPPPSSMLTLLRELTARQVIPNCASKGFSRPEDDLYQRLRAFLCSYGWDGRTGHPAFQRLQRRLDQVTHFLQDKSGTFYMDDQEKAKFEELCLAVNSIKENGLHGKE